MIDVIVVILNEIVLLVVVVFWMLGGPRFVLVVYGVTLQWSVEAGRVPHRTILIQFFGTVNIQILRLYCRYLYSILQRDFTGPSLKNHFLYQCFTATDFLVTKITSIT